MHYGLVVNVTEDFYILVQFVLSDLFSGQDVFNQLASPKIRLKMWQFQLCYLVLSVA